MLERFFFVDDSDRELVAKRRGDHNRLGFGLQLVTVRHLLSWMIPDIPTAVVDFVAVPVGVADPSCVKRYQNGSRLGSSTSGRSPIRFRHSGLAI